MQYLQKTWVRIIISLFSGGMVAEILHISTGGPNRKSGSQESFISLVSAVVIYFILTSFTKKAG